ncbi:MAG TPA: helix-turn-helix transcriptional regulator [Anaerolineae bacterium]|nr:helix-turn-helix transcriptional regulator [Anaerolineae bacterium]
MNLFEYVGQRIRDLRLSYGSGQGLSQEALARSLGVAANTVSRWETATYRPSLEDLDQLARFFGVSIMEFFPPEEVVGNDQMAALLRTAQQLKPEDLEELRRYAEFRRARSLYPSRERPQVGRKRKAVP